jgi:hypothetical protein
MLPTPWLLALALVIGLLVLIPSRRLQLSGVSARMIGLYALAVWIVAMTIAVRPAGARILVPFLLVAYLAPFVAAPDQVRRVLRRGGRPPGDAPPIKNVTPPGTPGDAGSPDHGDEGPGRS